ncbi:Rho GTPase activation protein [Pilobolus umbonatus]|nr:Rho GTPase activation protein [Pilobolus umbonatus]
MNMNDHPIIIKKKYRNPFTFLFNKNYKPTKSAVVEKKGIFGMSLTYASKNGSLLEDIKVPDPVYLCFNEIMRRGLRTEGVFRLSGATSEVSLLENKMNSCISNEIKEIDMSIYDIHTLTSLVKKYLRELPEPTIPIGFHQLLLSTDPTHIHDISKIMLQLPYYNRQLIHAILLVSSRIQDHVEVNMMNPEALATVFAPVCTGFEKSLKDTELTIKSKRSKASPLFKYRENSLEMHINRNKNWTNIWRSMIEHHESIISLLNKEECISLSQRNLISHYPPQKHNKTLPSPFSTTGSRIPLPGDIMMEQFYPLNNEHKSVIPVIKPTPYDNKNEADDEEDTINGLHTLSKTFFPQSHTVRKILSASALR